MNPLRIFAALTACLVLSGCFLMSEEPRFGDAGAVALLGPDATTFAHFDRDGDGWIRSDLAVVEMIPEGNHYLLHDPTNPDAAEADPLVHFVGLDAEHWLMQMTFSDAGQGAQTYYGVGSWDGAELLVTSIACDYLRDRPGVAELVSFSGDDCSLLPQTPGTAPDFPALLWQDLPPPDKKLVLQP